MSNPESGELPPPNDASDRSLDERAIHESNSLRDVSLQANDPRVLAFLYEYKGPLPPPAILQQYEMIVSGSARKIIENAYSQSKHRQRLETTVVVGGVRHERLGVIIGGTVSIVAIVTGGIVAVLGAPAAGATIATAIVVGLVGVFVYGTDSRRRERQAKDELKKKFDQTNSPSDPSKEPKHDPST